MVSSSPKTNMKKELFTDDEIQTLIMCLGASQKTFSEDDVIALTDWATNARVNAALLSGLLKGNIVVKIEKGEPCFNLSEDGIKLVEKKRI